MTLSIRVGLGIELSLADVDHRKKRNADGGGWTCEAEARLTPEQRPLLLKAQRIWVQYRDANCAVDFAHEGTVADYLGNKCLLTMTRDRTKELHSLHDEDTD